MASDKCRTSTQIINKSSRRGHYLGDVQPYHHHPKLKFICHRSSSGNYQRSNRNREVTCNAYTWRWSIWFRDSILSNGVPVQIFAPHVWIETRLDFLNHESFTNMFFNVMECSFLAKSIRRAAKGQQPTLWIAWTRMAKNHNNYEMWCTYKLGQQHI